MNPLLTYRAWLDTVDPSGDVVALDAEPNGSQASSLSLELHFIEDNIEMAEREIIANQKQILENQAMILENQQAIRDNQQAIKDNQAAIKENQKGIKKNHEALDLVLKNQQQILAALGKEKR
jgi:hypothetical protein